MSKASEVMSSIPPPSLHRSKFPVSRLSPSFPIGKPTRRCKNTTYLRQKYVESLEKERHSELSLNFNTPIRDYFEETVNSQKIAQFSLESEKNNTNANTVEIEAKVVIPEVHIQEAKHEIMKPRYANFVMPPPFVNEKKNLMQKKIISDLKKPKNNHDLSQKFINQSLQTDVNTFEFDEWEFDYDA